MTASFQKELPVAPLSSDLENMIEQCASYAPATKSLGRSHRLQLTFSCGELFQCSATEQYFVVPGGPEGYARCLELLRVKSEYVLLRSDFVHVPQMFRKERKHLRPRYIVDLDPHPWPPCGSTPQCSGGTPSSVVIHHVLDAAGKHDPRIPVAHK